MTKRGGKGGKKAQLNLSFGMIFSIFLIVVFIAAAIYAIVKFLDLQSTIQISKFSQDLQEDINRAWRGDSGNQSVEYSLPEKIERVCFERDNEFENIKFDSEQIIKGKMLENIDIGAITEIENPYCINNVDGKIKMRIVKKSGEILVRIVRQNDRN